MSQEQMRITGTEARKLFSKIHVVTVISDECADDNEIKKETINVIQEHLDDPGIIVEDFDINAIDSIDIFFREAE